MSLIKFSRRRPWLSEELEDLFGTENLFKDETWSRAILRQPAMNIREDEEKYELELAVPGLAKDDFSVTVDNGYLNVAVEKETSEENTQDNYTRKEFSYERFNRSVMLPENAREDDIKANYENGLLHISIAKRTAAEVSEIKKVEVD